MSLGIHCSNYRPFHLVYYVLLIKINFQHHRYFLLLYFFSRKPWNQLSSTMQYIVIVLEYLICVGKCFSLNRSIIYAYKHKSKVITLKASLSLHITAAYNIMCTQRRLITPGAWGFEKLRIRSKGCISLVLETWGFSCKIEHPTRLSCE